MFRIAEKDDAESLCKLWKSGFGEDENTALFVFEKFAGYENIILSCGEDGKANAMLCAVPVTLKNKKGRYLYGLTTSPELRGKGIMSELLQFAKQKYAQSGDDFFVLIPQSEQLFEFYKKRGFTEIISLRRFKRQVKNNLLAQGEHDGITAKTLPELREKFLPKNRVILNPAAETATVLDMYTNGACTVQTKDGYGIYYKQGDVMFFEEIAANSAYAAEIIIEAARQRCGCTAAEGYAAADCEYFLGEGPIRPFACLEFLKEPFSADDIYINMAMN